MRIAFGLITAAALIALHLPQGSVLTPMQQGEVGAYRQGLAAQQKGEPVAPEWTATYGGTPAPCLYYLVTPLQDAKNAMRTLGVDPLHTPYGYDITSRAGC